MKMNMKKIISWGMMLAAAFTLTNCAKEIDAPVQEPESVGYPFEIIASTVDTKTVNDGMHTKWAAEDKINLFHAVTGGTQYGTNDEFTISDVDEARFTGTLTEPLEADEAYDWYAFYPYDSHITTPANTSSGYMPVGSKSNVNQTQTENNSMAHIAGATYPLAGKSVAVSAGDTPKITMSHLSSLLAIKVTNNNDESLTVTEVAFTAPVDIIGTYYINFAGEITPDSFKSSGSSYVSNTATLTVKNGTALTKGESAKFYLAVRPFTAESGKELTISVNGYPKTITLSDAVTFNAGKIKTLNFGYDKKVSEATGIALPWVEDFSSKDLSKYVIVNGTGGSKTALQTSDALAGGEVPEILISKSGGSLTATIATGGFSGDLTLTFKSNHADYITVSATGVTVKKVTDSEYTIIVPEGLSVFDVTLKNSNSSNTRVDDIELAKSRLVQDIVFDEDVFEFEIGSDQMQSFVGQVVSGNQTQVTYSSNNTDVAIVDAETGEVELTGESGTAVITATAVQTAEYRSAVATYSIIITNPSATVVEKTVTYNFGKDTEVGFSKWDSSYKTRTATYADATVTFESANKQSQTITDCPVTKGSSVSIVMGDNRTLKSFNLTLKKWSSKAQTVTLHYSKDGGATYTKTSTTSSNFALSASVPEGTNAIKFTFSSSSNQVGIVSCGLTFDVAE